MGMVAAGAAFCVSGNHEAKLLRALRGRNVKVNHGLAESLAQLARETDEFRAEVERFIDGLISHYVLDGGRLVVAHAGLIEAYQGRASGRVREFACTGRRPARPMSTACRSATRGRRSTAAAPWCCMATPRCRRPSG